jgi:hypothetical protein
MIFSFYLNEEDALTLLKFKDLAIYISKPEFNTVRTQGITYRPDAKVQNILYDLKIQLLTQYTINRDELWNYHEIIVYSDNNEKLFQYRLCITEEQSNGFLAILRTLPLDKNLDYLSVYLEKEIFDKLLNENNNSNFKIKL